MVVAQFVGKVILGLNGKDFIFTQKPTAVIVSIVDTVPNYINYITILPASLWATKIFIIPG